MAGGPARKGLDGDEFSIQVTYFIDASIAFLNLKSTKIDTRSGIRPLWQEILQ
jgi:hypothetical protein